MQLSGCSDSRAQRADAATIRCSGRAGNISVVAREHRQQRRAQRRTADDMQACGRRRLPAISSASACRGTAIRSPPGPPPPTEWIAGVERIGWSRIAYATCLVVRPGSDRDPRQIGLRYRLELEVPGGGGQRVSAGPIGIAGRGLAALLKLEAHRVMRATT